MKGCKHDGGSQRGNRGAGRASNDGKQAATKEGFFDNRSERHIEEQKIPQAD
jgi:hypothetical protein